MQMVDLEVQNVMRSWKVAHNGAAVLGFSPDGRLLAGANDDEAYLWEVASGELLARAKLPQPCVPSQIVVTRDERVLLVGHCFDPDRGIRSFPRVVWDMQARKILRTTIPARRRAPVTLSTDGRTLALGCDDSSILLYDVPQLLTAKPSTPTAGECKRLWTDLASRDARRAWRAQQRLEASPANALVMLGKRLRPASFRQVPNELADLDSEDFTIRTAATKTLAQALKLGDRHIELALRDLLQSKSSLEAHLRARRLLTQAATLAYSPEELRQIRAVAVLERIGTSDAKALLKRWAAGGVSVLTREAHATLRRMP